MATIGELGSGTPSADGKMGAIGGNLLTTGLPSTPASLAAEHAAMGVVVSIAKYGAKSDGVALYDATSTASTNSVIGSASAQFTQADIGKACAILPYTATGLTPRWGTITAVNSSTEVVTSLSASPGALSGATFVYGTNDSAAIDAALAAVAALPFKGDIFFPPGITVTNACHVIPTGCGILGAFNNPTGGKAKDFRHYGSSLVLLKSYASGVFITTGDETVSSNVRGCRIGHINIDCFNLSVKCVTSGSMNRTEHFFNATFVRATNEVCSTSATNRTNLCCFIGSNNYNVVQVGGDSNFTNNIVTGAGNGYYGVKCSNGDDILISHNHIWKDSSDNTMLGGAVWLSFNSGDVNSGGVTVANNKFDTSYGPHVKVSVSGNSIARGVNILGNHGFQNDNVPDATYPYMELSVGAGSSIRGLNIQGNLGRGSFADAAQARYTYFIDNSASAGSIYGSNVGGNTIDNCDGMFNAFTPNHDHGNITIAGTGTVLTKSTTT